MQKLRVPATARSLSGFSKMERRVGDEFVKANKNKTNKLGQVGSVRGIGELRELLLALDVEAE